MVPRDTHLRVVNLTLRFPEVAKMKELTSKFKKSSQSGWKKPGICSTKMVSRVTNSQSILQTQPEHCIPLTKKLIYNNLSFNQLTLDYQPSSQYWDANSELHTLLAAIVLLNQKC